MTFLPQPLHPAIVHFPIVLILLGTVVALAAVVTRRWHLPVIAAITLGLGGLGAFAAAATGEQDEDRVENGANAALLEIHEEWAERTQVAAAVAACLAIAAAASIRWPVVARGLGVLTAISALAASGGVVATGHYGGQLVYGDTAAGLQANAGGASQPADNPADLRHRREDRDDD